MYSVGKAEQEILGDQTLNMWGKMRALTAIQNAAAKPANQGGPSITAGDIARGAIGAGIGYGAAVLMGKLLGVSDKTKTVFKGLGMGLGTLLNMGNPMNKRSSDDQEQVHAFRLGFMKAALEVGMIKEAIHPVLPIGPEMITGPVNTGLQWGASTAANTGGILGHLVGADETDLAVERMQLEQRELESQESSLKAARRAAALKRVLGKRIR